MKITVPIYYTQELKTKKDRTILLGLNSYRNMHYRLNNEIKQYYKQMVFDMCVGKVVQTPCKVKFTVYLKNKSTDGGNVRSFIEKAVLDGFVKAGVIKDDSVGFVVGDSAEYFIDKENPRCEIELYSV